MDAPIHSDARTHSDVQNADQQEQSDFARAVSGRVAGLQGRLARPFWGVLGIWAAVCGALASKHIRWTGGDLLTLALILLLAELAWGSLWDLLVGTDWRHLGAARHPLGQPVVLAGLPYTQPNSPGGRVFGGLSRLAHWWRGVFWPTAGPAMLGSLVAVVLAIVVSQFLPDRIRVLNVALLGLVGLGILQRWRGRAPLATQATVLVGLGWLAGNAAFSEVSHPSLILALCFALAAWGVFRSGGGLRGGLWLQDGGQVMVVVLLVALEEPLAAALVGLLLFGQIALQPALSGSEGPSCWPRSDPALATRWAWPWLLATMVVAAWAIP